jgi:hypothetical protein
MFDVSLELTLSLPSWPESGGKYIWTLQNVWNWDVQKQKTLHVAEENFERLFRV